MLHLHAGLFQRGNLCDLFASLNDYSARKEFTHTCDPSFQEFTSTEKGYEMEPTEMLLLKNKEFNALIKD